MADDGGVGNTGGGGAHQDFHGGEVLADQIHQTGFHMSADFGSGQSQAVVTVDGALDAGGPGEGLIGTQEHGADAQQVMGDGFFDTHFKNPPSY